MFSCHCWFNTKISHSVELVFSQMPPPAPSRKPLWWAYLKSQALFSSMGTLLHVCGNFGAVLYTISPRCSFFFCCCCSHFSVFNVFWQFHTCVQYIVILVISTPSLMSSLHAGPVQAHLVVRPASSGGVWSVCILCWHKLYEDFFSPGIHQIIQLVNSLYPSNPTGLKLKSFPPRLFLKPPTTEPIR